MNDFLDEHQTGLMLLRIAVVCSFFIGAYSVLVTFIDLAVYGYFVFYGGGINPVENPEWISWWQEIQQTKTQFLLFNLYNIIVWNAVIIFTIWLFRFYDWARRVLGAVLGFDMVFTVGHLVWLLYRNELDIASPGSFILLNAVQVGVIVLLSHPDVVKLTEVHTTLRKTMQQNEVGNQKE